MNIKPTKDLVMLKQIIEENKTEGGLIIGNQDDVLKWKVLDVGKDVKDIKKGEIVYCKIFKPVKIGGEEIVFAPEGNILAKIND